MTSHFSIGLPTWQSRMPRILTDSNFKQPQHSTSLRAKRSNPCSRKGRVDCFVASLLAMTANTVSRSRCMFCPRFAFDVPPPEYQRAQGMPGARCTRSLVCDKKQTHERSHHGHTGNHPAFPAQWFYGLLRALPGDQACLTPSPARLLADLTPTMGRQNDTTWPYASASFVRLAIARLTLPRPPHPVPRFVTTRDPPLLSERDGANQ